MWDLAGRSDAHAAAAVTSGRRSLVKAITYRLVVMCADAAAIYLLTGKWRLAAGFMIASSVYTTALYFLHERLWARIGWGRQLEPRGTQDQPQSRLA
ncbi:DUF2061 domain-containing protein [Phenylobacterium soli]|uniref:DUF2061 domain-containing protein n=1 Tax=Phenylobacterium soli TaxID=2170551 RepID=A0A328AJC5_9CAUL|nr:DUF2061 domain-containing protein [Phenylobacterium soli]RAK54962.1 hypothetical protein DJ017_10690 [Phenylobacterium soli]